MSTYYIPRNTKGEGKILYIFSTKALIYTVVGAIIGLIFYYICTLFKANIIGLILILVFAAIGFGVGTIKIPDSPNFEITRKAGGQNIDEVIVRYIKFKLNKKKIYVYEEETKDE